MRTKSTMPPCSRSVEKLYFKALGTSNSAQLHSCNSMAWINGFTAGSFRPIYGLTPASSSAFRAPAWPFCTATQVASLAPKLCTDLFHLPKSSWIEATSPQAAKLSSL